MVWEWDSDSHKKIKVKKTGIKKLKDEWIWQSVKIGSGAQGYGSHQIGEILEEEVYPCAFCKGTGEKPRGSRCSVCKGKGTVSVDPPAVRCAYCKGKGEEKPRTNITCTACRGKGVIHVEEPIEICPHCRGTGKESTNKLICINCRGKGVVTVKEGLEEIGTFAQERYQVNKAEKEKPVHSASGSEKEALNVVKGLGKPDKIAVARNMLPPISSTYAEQLCNALVKKGLLTRQGLFYSITHDAEKTLGNFGGG